MLHVCNSCSYNTWYSPRTANLRRAAGFTASINLGKTSDNTNLTL